MNDKNNKEVTKNKDHKETYSKTSQEIKAEGKLKK